MRVIEPEIDEQVVSSGWTTAIAILMIVLGIIAIAFQMRRISSNWGLMLASGIIGIIFDIFVWSNFPFNAVWLIGTLIGINLLFDGVWMLTLHSGQRRAL